MSHQVVPGLVSVVCPWLALVLCLQCVAAWRGVSVRGRTLMLSSGAVALVVLLLPVNGIVIAHWVAGISANFSIPLTGMLAVSVCERAFSKRILSVQDWRAAWSFGAIGGLALYPLALGLSSFDPYEWGWHVSPLFVLMAVLTSWLIWKQNRFGLLLLLAVVAFHLRLLESTNYWDYLVDPLYCLASLVVLGRRSAAHIGLVRRSQAAF